jgi:two-component system sensor histidine kinase ResE
VLSFSAIPVPTLLGLFVFAFVSWLSARSLEGALKDLRAINRELDQRVEERTRDLAEALAENQAILQGIADGVIVFDNTGEAIVANPAMGRLLRRSPDSILGHDIDSLMTTDVTPEEQEMVRDLMAERRRSYSGLKFQWGEKTLSVSLAPVHDNFDSVAGTVAVFRDFTREAELDRMKSAFVSMVSHELRTPLNAILGYTEMLEEEICGPLSEKQSEVVGRVIVNTGKLLGLVNNLLDQAQIEAGRLTLRIRSFTPDELLDAVLPDVRMLAQAEGLEITSEIADDVPDELLGDQERLQQVLVNLTTNAVKFTDDGEVRVSIFRPDEQHWGFKVSDTGKGIAPEDQEFIFDSFRRVDDSVTRERSGVGLGLSIVKQLVVLMEGEISLESEVGRGSTFTVILPLSPKQEE